MKKVTFKTKYLSDRFLTYYFVLNLSNFHHIYLLICSIIVLIFNKITETNYVAAKIDYTFVCIVDQ